MADWETLKFVALIIGVAVGPIYPTLLYLISKTACNSTDIAKVQTENDIYHDKERKTND